MSVHDLPDASVVLVSFNTRDLLRECILTLQRESGGVPHETIVVDNASRDGSADMVATDFPEVRLIRSSINLGFAAANNRAFQMARGRYIVLLNSDAFLRPGALRLSIEHMDEYPRVGLAGGRLVGRDGSWQPSARMYPSALNSLLSMSGLAAKFPKSRFLGRVDRTWRFRFSPRKSTGCQVPTASYGAACSTRLAYLMNGSFSITRKSISADASRLLTTRSGIGPT